MLSLPWGSRQRRSWAADGAPASVARIGGRTRAVLVTVSSSAGGAARRITVGTTVFRDGRRCGRHHHGHSLDGSGPLVTGRPQEDDVEHVPPGIDVGRDPGIGGDCGLSADYSRGPRWGRRCLADGRMHCDHAADQAELDSGFRAALLELLPALPLKESRTCVRAAAASGGRLSGALARSDMTRSFTASGTWGFRSRDGIGATVRCW